MTGLLHKCLTKRITGQLPFLKEGDEIVAPASSIISYLVHDQNGFDTSALKATFNPEDTAWLAHAESNLGDLVVCYGKALR